MAIAFVAVQRRMAGCFAFLSASSLLELSGMVISSSSESQNAASSLQLVAAEILA
jgi:hypothetical protein